MSVHVSALDNQMLVYARAFDYVPLVFQDYSFGVMIIL